MPFTSRSSGAPVQSKAALHENQLVCIGAEDPLIPPEQRTAFEEEMRAGGVAWQIHLYGGAAHSFSDPNASSLGMPGVEYHEPSDRRSWKAMLDFFDETIKA